MDSVMHVYITGTRVSTVQLGTESVPAPGGSPVHPILPTQHLPARVTPSRLLA